MVGVALGHAQDAGVVVVQAVVGHPEPQVVAYGPAAVDLHHVLDPHGLVVRPAGTAHNVVDHAGIVPAARKRRALGAELQQRVVAEGGGAVVVGRLAGLQHQRGDAHALHLAHLHDGAALEGGDQRGEAQAEEHDVWLVDLDGAVQLVHPGREDDVEALLDLGVDVSGRGRVGVGDVDLLWNGRGDARAPVMPRVVVLHLWDLQLELLLALIVPEVRLLRKRVRGGGVALAHVLGLRPFADGAVVGPSGVDVHAARTDVAPGTRLLVVAPDCGAAGVPLLLRARLQVPPHLRVGQAAARGPERGRPREAQVAVDLHGAHGRGLGDPEVDVVLHVHILDAPPEGVRGGRVPATVHADAVAALPGAHGGVRGELPEPEDRHVVADVHVHVVVAGHEEDRVAVVAKLRVVVPVLGLAEDLLELPVDVAGEVPCGHQVDVVPEGMAHRLALAHRLHAPAATSAAARGAMPALHLLATPGPAVVQGVLARPRLASV
mmetsp:Transcript_91429/g.284957  ORF Transcript_91429/g.284957 Transcript_91429/m.284957 type:complete len:491 (+) Transcript_91429:571-2043(+)